MSDLTGTGGSKRVLYNTLLLYVRMFIIMLISIFSFRIILERFSVNGYGVYTVIAGLITFLNFLNNAVLITVQRFLNVEMAQKDNNRTGVAFVCSLVMFAGLALAVIILASTGGLWYLLNKLEIVPEYRSASVMIFFLLLGSAVIRLMHQPFYALIIASEQMAILAGISLLEVLLNLLAVLSLTAGTDSVVFYSLWTVINSFILLVFYIVYCRKRYRDICNFDVRYLKKNYFKQMVSFSGWSIMGSLASGVSLQGINLLLNAFGGVIVNAAFGLAQQINNVAASFLVNFQTAFIPYLLKTCQVDRESAQYAICRTAKYSFFLISFVVYPILAFTDPVIGIFTSEPPPYAAVFTRLMLVQLLISSLTCPLYTAVQATGRIKNYQIVVSSIMMTLLPVSYLLMKCGLSYSFVFACSISIDILLLFIRIFFVWKLVGLPVSSFIKSTLFRVLLVGAAMCGILIFCRFEINNLLYLVMYSALLDFILLIAIILLGVSPRELYFICNWVRQYVSGYLSGNK